MHRRPDPRSRAGYLGRFIGDDTYPRPGQLDCPVVMEVTDNVLSTCQPTNVLNHVTLRHVVLVADASTSRNRRWRGVARRELFGGVRRSCGVDASGHGSSGSRGVRNIKQGSYMAVTAHKDGLTDQMTTGAQRRG
jgi:hypothetical protein